ncbi:MAG: hypothetical protein M1353_03280 [Nitrospirae bacterium]|nr:hypothetical protein [Nitrospirota bacterium]
MGKKLIYFCGLFLFIGIVFINPAFSGMECEGTQYNGVFYKKGGPPYYPIKNGVTYECEPCGSCTPKSSGSTPFVPSGRLSPSQQMAVGILQPFFNSLFDFSDLFAPPDTSRQDALREQEAKELLKQQEMKKQAIEQWLNLQAEAEANRLKEEAERKRKGEAILAQSSIGGGELKMESIGGGKLTPFSWDTPMTLEPAPSWQYKTEKFTEMERLLCSAYFSKMAENAANSGDLEGARFYGSQMDNVMQGFPTAIECKPPKDLSSTADMKKLGELNQKYTKMATIYKEIMLKIDNLQEIEVKLDEVKKKKEDAEQKITELDKQINGIKARSQTADTPEKKAQEDDLLAQAMALKSDAEKQQQEAVQSEEKLTKEKQNIEDELNSIKDKMQAGGGQ